MSSSIFISIFNVSRLKLQDFEYEDEYPETLVLYNTVQCCTVLNINIHLNIRISSSSGCCRGWSSHSPPRRWPHGLEACCCPSLSHRRQCFCKYNLLMSELISMEIFYSRTFGSLTLDLTCSACQWGSRWEWRQQALSWACCSCGSVVNQVVIKVIV